MVNQGENTPLLYDVIAITEVSPPFAVLLGIL
jgi:hypothetical protein